MNWVVILLKKNKGVYLDLYTYFYIYFEDYFDFNIDIHIIYTKLQINKAYNQTMLT